MALLVVGSLVLFAIVAQDAPVRSAAVVVAVSVVLAGLAVPYARSGLAWWGGPLASPRYLGGGNGAGLFARPDHPLVFQGLLYLQNGGRVTATLDGLDFVGRTPPFRVLGTYVLTEPCSVNNLDVSGLQRCGSPLHGFRARPGPAVQLAAVVEVDAPGTYRVGWFGLTYHVGPLPFEIFRTEELSLCAPPAGKTSCPGF